MENILIPSSMTLFLNSLIRGANKISRNPASRYPMENDPRNIMVAMIR